MGINKSPINTLLSLLFCAFFLFLLYDVGFNGGVYTLMVVNIAKSKQLGNQRSSTSDISVQLTPPRTFTLEEALEYITDDELVEITPQNVRMRKRLLSAVDRKKAAKK